MCRAPLPELLDSFCKSQQSQPIVVPCIDMGWSFGTLGELEMTYYIFDDCQVRNRLHARYEAAKAKGDTYFIMLLTMDALDVQQSVNLIHEMEYFLDSMKPVMSHYLMRKILEDMDYSDVSDDISDITQILSQRVVECPMTSMSSMSSMSAIYTALVAQVEHSGMEQTMRVLETDAQTALARAVARHQMLFQ
jgi:hypothetical protein